MIPDHVVEAVSLEKELSGTVSWSDDGGYSWSRPPLVVDGVGVEGLFVRIKVANSIDAFRSMVQVEWDAPRNTHALARIDWKVGHTNPNKGPSELRLERIESSHVHEFDLNYLRLERRMMQKNLPIARPLSPDPNSLEEFFATAQVEFKIKGLAQIARPPFQAGLF